MGLAGATRWPLVTELGGQGGIAHLRARACWAMGHLADLMHKESDFYLQVVRCVVDLVLRDPELPVRFQVSVHVMCSLCASARGC